MALKSFCFNGEQGGRRGTRAKQQTEREFLIGNLLVRNHLIIVMIRWTGLAPWVFEVLSFR